MIIYLIFFTFGYFTYPIIATIFDGKSKKDSVQDTIDDDKKIKITSRFEGNQLVNELGGNAIGNKPKHLEPKYHGYKGGYDVITKCQKCDMTALYEDQQPANPCHFCGGKVNPDGAAKWMQIDNQYQWNKTA